MAERSAAWHGKAQHSIVQHRAGEQSRTQLNDLMGKDVAAVTQCKITLPKKHSACKATPVCGPGHKTYRWPHPVCWGPIQ